MTVPEFNKPVTTVTVIPTATSTRVHCFVRQAPVTSSEASRGDHNGRVSVQPTGFEGGLLVGLYDPHLGPQCAEYLQQHLVPILDESLSTQLDHSDDDHHQNPNTCKIDPTQVVDTLKSTFKELDELLLATAITVALTQPETADQLPSEEELKKTQEVIARVVTGSTALVGFLAPHTAPSSATTTGSETNDAVLKHDLYLAQLGDSVAILAGFDAQGQWTAQRLNPPETHEHSVRYQGSEEYRKVVSEVKERALTVEQFLTQHNGSSQHDHNGVDTDGASIGGAHESFLTKDGKFLGLPVTRAFGDLDWKLEQEARFSVATWVEKSLRAKIDQALGSGQQQQESNGEGSMSGRSQDEAGINNLSDPPYVSADPRISRFVLETRKPSHPDPQRASNQLLILVNRGLLYTTAHSTTNSNRNGTDAGGKPNPYDQALISDFELSRLVSSALEKGEENCAAAVAKVLDQTRKDLGVANSEGEEEGLEGSVVAIVL
ncbi:hypothetical protein BC939DRAFT_498205 [Gamsiella multidivaricata]|uniref:uncharacterized protein n=1 Tax=Gamsiella multidivaricata TaxID=101098 RepID=UPI00221F63CF|nr:uncharacterized protein BC939DRAFT_498205 [Gamsiella multidivaricata]KAG0371346.1 hypothetical protein BGZ54_005470 [Gamsiella multidivaricata]KAI7832810.1 hypothetical protein BC939DRAFT_498205 [Gamsiella multidivaricata]